VSGSESETAAVRHDGGAQQRARVRPAPSAWLSLPLTQERAAAIVQFQERTGIELIDVLTDALDDIVFDLGPARQPGGNLAHRAGARPGEGANEF
jgi:hypothetical protein